MINQIDTNIISLFSLGILLVFFLTWLVLRTLKEGIIALHEIKKDSKYPKKCQ